MQVSVILPNYNHEHYLQQRIKSILDQSYQDFELIIIDDASTDESTAILETYKSHSKVSHYIHNEKNSGSPFLQWQKGIELAKGNYIWIAESDDFAEPSFLEQTVRLMEEMPQAGLVYTDSQIIDADNNKQELWSNHKNIFFNTERWSGNYVNKGRNEVVDYLLYKTTIINASAVLFRARFLKDPNYLEDLRTYKNAGDLCTYIHLAFQGDLAYIGLPLNNYRMHTENITKANMKSGVVYNELLRCYSKVVDLLYLTDVDPKAMIKIRRACKAILKKNGFLLVDKQYFDSLKLFIRKCVAHKIFSVREGHLILVLFKIYGWNVIKIKGLAKKFLRSRLNRE